MRWPIVLLVALWVALAAGSRRPAATQGQEGPHVRVVTGPVGAVPRFALAEFQVDVVTSAERVYYPFGVDDGYTHPDGVTVDALITEPSGSTVTVPAFYYTPYALAEVHAQREALGITGPSDWRIRYTPRATGAHRLVVRVQDARGSVTSAPQTFTVAPSERRGFVRVSRADPRLLEYDNGDAFIPIAEGRQWAPIETKRAMSYAAAFASDARAGVNLTRLWDQNDSFNLSIEGADPVWAPRWSQFTDALGIAVEGAHTGHRTARFRPRSGSRTEGYVQWVAVTPSTRYRLSGWIRTENVDGDGALFAVGGDMNNPGRIRTDAVKGTAAWQQASTEFTTAADEHAVLVWAGGVSATGTAYLDDVALTPVRSGGVNALSDPGFERHFPKADAGNDPEDPALVRTVPKGTWINQWSAFQLDRILAAAEADGIAVQLCSHADAYWTWDATVHDGDFTKGNGYQVGWLDVRRMGYWQRNYRYRIARWGHSPAVLAWEVWNEHGLIDVPSELQQFYARLGAFVAATDPYRHLFTTSQWSQAYSPRFWTETPFDVANYHDYITTELDRHPPALADDAAAFVYRLADGLVADWPAGAARKPFIWGEIGTLKAWDVDDPLLASGAGGTLTRHQFLWAGLFSPLLTSPIDWQSTPKAESTRALRAYVSGEPWASAGWQPFASPDLEARVARPLTVQAPDVRVMALVNRDGTRVLAWVQHRDDTWRKVVQQHQRPRPASGWFAIPDVSAGAYEVEWWDTWTGSVTLRRTVQHAGGPLTLAWPAPLTDDVAVKVRRR